MAKQGLPAATPGTRTSPRIKDKRLARTSNTGKPESKSERAKRKAATAAAKAIAAGEKSAKPKATEVQETPAADTNTEEDDPVEIVTKPPKNRVVPPPTKKRRKQKESKKSKAVVVSIPEEINDDSLYSDEEVNEKKKDELDDDDEEYNSTSGDENDMVPHDSSDKDNSSTERTRCFQRDVEKTSAPRWKFDIVRGSTNTPSTVQRILHTTQV